MTKPPAANGVDERTTLFTAQWHIYSPTAPRVSSVTFGSSIHVPGRPCELGPQATLEIPTMPYPIPEHHFVSYMLSLMSNCIDMAELNPEKIDYRDSLRAIPANFVPRYFPMLPQQR